MGVILEPIAAMQPFHVEVRRESFYLYSYEPDDALTLYPDAGDGRSGTVEINIEDIPKLRAALDLVERYVKER